MHEARIIERGSRGPPGRRQHDVSIAERQGPFAVQRNVNELRSPLPFDPIRLQDVSERGWIGGDRAELQVASAPQFA